VLLDDDALGAIAVGDEQILERAACRGLVGRDHDALAGGQAIGLEHRGIGAGDRSHPVLDVGDDPVGGGRDAGGAHHLLAERLGPLQSRRTAIGAEAAHSCRPQRVGDARDERGLGADHHQRGTGRLGQRDDRVRILGVDSADHVGIGRDPGVARRADQLRGARRAGERLDERMLARTAAEHQHNVGHRARSNR